MVSHMACLMRGKTDIQQVPGIQCTRSWKHKRTALEWASYKGVILLFMESVMKLFFCSDHIIRQFFEKSFGSFLRNHSAVFEKPFGSF